MSTRCLMGNIVQKWNSCRDSSWNVEKKQGKMLVYETSIQTNRKRKNFECFPGWLLKYNNRSNSFKALLQLTFKLVLNTNFPFYFRFIWHFGFSSCFSCQKQGNLTLSCDLFSFYTLMRLPFTVTVYIGGDWRVSGERVDIAFFILCCTCRWVDYV